MPSTRQPDAGPLRVGTATLLALLAAVILHRQYLREVDLDLWWSAGTRFVEQSRPWLVGAAAVLAVVLRRWAVTVYAALSVWGVLELATMFGSMTPWPELGLFPGAAGLLLLTAGVLGAAATAPAASRTQSPVSVLVLAWFGSGMWLLGMLVSFPDAVSGDGGFPAGDLLSEAVSAALVVVLLSMVLAGSSRWIGGALLGLGLRVLLSQTDFLLFIVHRPTAGHYEADYLDMLYLLVGLFMTAAGVRVLIACDPWRRLPPLDGPRPSSDDTTRALCAAMHLDRKLARGVAGEVVDRVTRGIAPSWGVDVGLVVRHCLWAVRRQTLRDAALAATVGLAVTVWLTSVTSEFSPWIIATVVLAPCVIIAVERWMATRAARRLRRGRECPPPRLGDEDEAVARAVEEAEAGNIMPFDGYFPFVGSGTETGGWSFVLEVPDQAAGPVRPQDLYDEICQGLNRLGIEGLTFDDRLYLDAEEVPPGSDLWTADELPVLRTHADDEELHEFVENPTLHHRVYRCVRVNGWRGEYVLSVFVNIERRASSLFVSARYFLLRPVEPRYAAMVRGDDTEDARLSAMMVAGARTALGLYLGSIPATVFWVRRAASRRPATPTMAVAGRRSVRELAQGPRFRRYFQQLDWEMTTKLLERELLASLARSLRKYGVDTAELEKRQTAILNYGVIVNGGELKAENMSVGKGAQSRLTRIVSAALVREENAKR